MVGYTEIFLRLILSVIAGGLIGLEREVVHKPAGIRTHMLVCLGSALFVLVAIETLPNEAARIIAGIATGIGFLGAGLILKDGFNVRNLTTAASLWVAAGIGMAIGYGFFVIAIMAGIVSAVAPRLPDVHRHPREHP